MTVYDLNNTIRLGRVAKTVTDATGAIHDKCLEVDTETGRIVKIRTATNGVPLYDPVNAEILKTEIMAPAPLIIDWITE